MTTLDKLEIFIIDLHKLPVIWSSPYTKTDTIEFKFVGISINDDYVRCSPLLLCTHFARTLYSYVIELENFKRYINCKELL